MERIYLEPLHRNKADLLRIAGERNKCLETLRTINPTPVSIDHQVKWLDSMNDGEKYFFIRHSRTAPAHGYCGLDKISHTNRTAEISLLVFQSERGKGYGSEAVRLLLDRAFNTYHLNVVFGECYQTTTNWDFWEKCGFVFEGDLRQRKWWNGKFYNSIIFSMTRDEWKQGS